MHVLPPSEMLAWMTKELAPNYHVVVVFLAVLVVLMLWRLWNFRRLYAEFPSYPLIPYIIISTVLRKVPAQAPFSVFYFQELIRLSKRFEKEGMFLALDLQPLLFIYNEEAVKIFSNAPEALNKSDNYEVLKDVVGNGLGTSDAATWKVQREMLNPVFHVDMLKKQLPIFNENAKILVKALSECKRDSPVDLLDFLRPCSFGNICEFILGLKWNRPEDRDLITYFEKLVTGSFQMVTYRTGKPWMHYKFMMKFTSTGRKYIKIIDEAHNLCRKLIIAVKENISQNLNTKDNPEDEQYTKKFFARILLDHHLKNPSFTTKEMENHVSTFMAAGYDTVSYTSMWCLFLLGHHPDIQDRVFNEVNTLSEESIKYENLQKLRYLECVIKETLRLYPTGPLYGRSISKNIQCGKHTVPKGTNVMFFVYALHRNPKIYPDPDNFNPNRFMDGNIKPWQFIPFSEGIRNCIGKRFAMMELKVILTYILKNFKVTSLDKIEEVILSWQITLVPLRHLMFKLTPR